MKNKTLFRQILGISFYALLAVCIFCVTAKAQKVGRNILIYEADTVQPLLIEDLIFYVRECASDSILVKVPADQYMIDNGNRIYEYYIPREVTLKGFAIWLGKKYYR